jgi:hypothetical protein
VVIVMHMKKVDGAKGESGTASSRLLQCSDGRKNLARDGIRWMRCQ